jgi:hypothetical protein
MRICALPLGVSAFMVSPLLLSLAGEPKPTPALASLPAPAVSSRTNRLTAASPVVITRTWVTTNLVRLNSNVWVFVTPTNRVTVRPRPWQSNIVKPGIYEAEPYKGIVVAPGPQWDDRCLVLGGNPNYPMPVQRPELRLIPRGK